MSAPTMEAGRELDALVAENVFGAAKFRHIDVVNGKRDETFGEFPGDPTHSLRCVPYYSTDIAAAWEVVVRVREKVGVYLELRETGAITTTANSVERETRWGARFVNHVGANFVTADTPSLAICLAALKAVEADA